MLVMLLRVKLELHYTIVENYLLYLRPYLDMEKSVTTVIIGSLKRGASNAEA
jgi:hypothetical protein